MIRKISIEELRELYLDTLQKCGTYLLNEEDKVIEYNIFEEFDSGVVSFLHIDNLTKLNDAGLINDEVMEKSSILRSMVMEIQESEKWDVEGVRSSPEWRKILELSDEIKKILE